MCSVIYFLNYYFHLIICIKCRLKCLPNVNSYFFVINFIWLFAFFFFGPLFLEFYVPSMYHFYKAVKWLLRNIASIYTSNIIVQEHRSYYTFTISFFILILTLDGWKWCFTILIYISIVISYIGYFSLFFIIPHW